MIPQPLRPLRRMLVALLPWLVRGALAAAFTSTLAAAPVGIFTDHLDIGPVKHPGSAAFAEAEGVYKVSASGANMWFKQDELHYVWKKVSGDNALTATIAFVGQSAEPHRKALLLIRQTLDADSPYA